MRHLILILLALTLGTGCFDLKHRDLGPVTPAATATAVPSGGGGGGSNGSWPTLSSFGADASNDNAGSTIDPGNDNQDGCGASGSSAAFAQQASGSWDASAFGRLTYNVATNAGCTYQYASVGFAMTTQHDVSAYTQFKFYARANPAASFKITLQGNAADACVPTPHNRMYFVQAVTTSWALYSIPFTSFTDRYGSCPYISGGWLAKTGSVSFAMESVNSGNLDLDDVLFAP